MPSIVIHQRPDFDCIGAAWLLEKFFFPGDVLIKFVRSGGTEIHATAVVDTGGELDGDNLRFDHHHLTGDEAQTSATKQVFQYLIVEGYPVEYLRDLVELINACDLGMQTPAADTSRRFGIHALLSSAKTSGYNDMDLWLYGCDLLNQVSAGLLARHTAAQELAQNIEWANEGLGVAVLKFNAPQGCTSAAYDAGYDLVFFQGQAADGGYTRGMIRRSGCTRYHCGEMVLAAWVRTQHAGQQALFAELSQWDRHPAGFFAGISEKGGTIPTPPPLDLKDIAKLILKGW